jgi:hypothetical protein
MQGVFEKRFEVVEVPHINQYVRREKILSACLARGISGLPGLFFAQDPNTFPPPAAFKELPAPSG